MLTAYEVHLSDGSKYTTSMAAGVTLADAEAYFLGKRQVDEDANGVETVRTVVRVEKVR